MEKRENKEKLTEPNIKIQINLFPFNSITLQLKSSQPEIPKSKEITYTIPETTGFLSTIISNTIG